MTGSEFSPTTAFRLLRRLALGQSGAMYLLVYREGDYPAVEADLRAEFEVQMANSLRIGRVSELLDVNETIELPEPGPFRAFLIDRWSPELVTLLDTHVVRLERTGAQFLFLTSPALAEQLLVEAPNFRSRLTDVLHLVPDEALKSGWH